MTAGRPKKHTKKTLKTAVEKYFNSISRTIQVVDDIGRIIYNDDGEAITRVEYVVKPSVSGLCLHLGIDRSTWQNYCDAEQHPELHEITSWARTVIEAFLEEALLSKDTARGAMFNLQNNCGWKQKQEVELGRETRRAAATAGLTVKEKLALIASERAAIAGVGE